MRKTPEGFCQWQTPEQLFGKADEARLWRDNLDKNGAAIRMRSGGRSASWSRRTRTDASPLCPLVGVPLPEFCSRSVPRATVMRRPEIS
jgi:hypothetical protein